MAPRRGGGSAGYNTATCSDAYTTTYAQAGLAYYVIYLVFFTGIFVATFFVRRKAGAGKKLIGVPFVVALFFQVLSRLLILISDIMWECMELGSNDYLNVTIASSVMSSLAQWVLLVVFVYILNSMLLKQLDVSSSGSKTVFRIIIGVMFAAIFADLALTSYVMISNLHYDFDSALTVLTAQGLGLTDNILWLISVVVSAAFSLSNISALRSRRLPGGDLVGWVAVLYMNLLIYSILNIVFSSSAFWPYPAILAGNTALALSYISALSQVITFIALLCIAKHISWSQTIEKTDQVYAPVTQQQATYGYGNGQQDYYQQTPELVHVK